MALKTTIFNTKITPQKTAILTTCESLLATLKKARFIVLLVISLLSFQIGFAQVTGDFRSKAIGPSEWTTIASWETWNGSAWINATTYPGQIEGTAAILIQYGHTITLNSTITTQNFGILTIAGRLVLNGDTSSGGMDFFINTTKIYVTPLPNGGFIEFNNKLNLRLPATAIFIVSLGGLDVASGCSANQIIYIGSTAYAKCNGGGSILPDFQDLMDFGGTLSANPTSNSPVCIGNLINLIGSYTGVVGKTTSGGNTDGVNYSWEITYPDGSKTYSTNKNISFSAPQILNYTSTLTCTTYFGEDLFTNSKTITVVVNSLPSAPTVGIITQPTCSTATGSVILNGLPIGNWTINPGGITGNTTSTIITGLAVGTTFNYTVTNSVGCTSTPSENVVINTAPTSNTWNGSVDTDWNTAGNWSCNVVPNSTSNILIPVVTYYPLISTEVEIKHLEIQSGALLNVSNNGLTITGTLTLNGKIDLQNESQMVQTIGSTIHPSSTGSIEIDQQGTFNNFYYNYWSSPLNNNGKYTVASILRDGSFPNKIKNIDFGTAFTYADNKTTITFDGDPIKISTYWINKFTNKPAGDNSSWTHIGKDGILNPGEGFTMKGSNRNDVQDQNYTFVGMPNNGNINLIVDNGMQYLIGNPYPSAIDANKFINDNSGSIDGTLYFWDHSGPDSHYLADYGLGYATYTTAGGVPAGGFGVPGGPPTPTRKVPQQYIPVAQGFFVNASTTGGGTIQFNNNQREFQKEDSFNSVFIRTSGENTSKKQSSETDATPKIYLNYNSPMGYYRQLMVAFIPNTTEGIDYGYDARNMDQFKEDLYWKTANTKLVIQAVPTMENRILPIEIKVAAKGIVKISIDFLENVADDTDIMLKDKESGMLYNLRTGTFEQNLSPGTYTNRFEIVLQPEKSSAVSEENMVDNLITIYLNNSENTILINHNESVNIKEISIYNILGQQLQSIKKGLQLQNVVIPFNNPTGVYLVKVTTNKEIISKKVIKQ